MKATRNIPEPTFTPIDLSLRIEHQYEAEALYTFFNASALYGTFGFSDESAKSIRDALGTASSWGHMERYTNIRNILRR